MTTYNMTSSAFSAISTISPSWTPLITIILMIAIGFTLFMFVKNFRRLLYGLAVTIPIGILGWMSYGIAKPAESGNFTPILITGGILVGIFVLIVVGTFVETLKIFNKIEESITMSIEDEGENGKHKKQKRN